MALDDYGSPGTTTTLGSGGTRTTGGQSGQLTSLFGQSPALPELVGAVGTAEQARLANNAAFGFQSGILGQQFQLGQDEYNANAALARQGFGADAAYIAAQRGIAERELANQHSRLDVAGEQAGLTRDVNISDLLEQATAQGAVTTRGHGRRRGNIFDQHGITMEDIGLRKEGAKISHDATIARLNHSASQLGVSRQKLENDLNFGLRKMGLDNALEIDQLMQARDQGNIAAQAIFNDALIAAGSLPLQTTPSPQEKVKQDTSTSLGPYFPGGIPGFGN